MNFELNGLLLTSGSYVEIVHPPTIAAGGRKNIKPVSNSPLTGYATCAQ